MDGVVNTVVDNVTKKANFSGLELGLAAVGAAYILKGAYDAGVAIRKAGSSDAELSVVSKVRCKVREVFKQAEQEG